MWCICLYLPSRIWEKQDCWSLLTSRTLKAAWRWRKSHRAFSLRLSKTTSGTSRPAVHSPGRGEKSFNHKHSSVWCKRTVKKTCCGPSLTPLFVSVPPSVSHLSIPHPPLVFCTSRLCQGLEWMMSRLRVRWCPLTPIKRAACVVFFLPPNTNLNRGDWHRWTLSWFLRCWYGRCAARTLYYRLW